MPNISGMMSPELMLKIFQEESEVKSKNLAIVQPIPLPSTSSQSVHPSIISVNDLFGSDEESRQGKDEEDEFTENSTDYEDNDYEWNSEHDGDGGVGKENLRYSIENRINFLNDFFSEKDIKFYKSRMEILSADLRARTLHKRLWEMQNKAKNLVSGFTPFFQIRFCVSVCGSSGRLLL